jgi:predicted phosphodiesterase
MLEPVRILSDLHLGHKVSRIAEVESLRPLIAGAGTVIFNGDTWQELAPQFYQDSARMLDKLKWLCAEEDVKTIFLPGNHDPGWPGKGWAELASGRIVITHGDALLHAGSPWKREILLNPDRVEALWSEHPRAVIAAEERLCVAREIARELCTIEHPTGRHFLQRAWDAIVPPQRALKMLESWATQGREGAKFCERYFPQAEVLVIGHFHSTGSWLCKGRRIINTGSFMAPGQPHWLEWNDGWLTRGVVDESAEIYRKGKVLDAWQL